MSSTLYEQLVDKAAVIDQLLHYYHQVKPCSQRVRLRKGLLKLMSAYNNIASYQVYHPFDWW